MPKNLYPPGDTRTKYPKISMLKRLVFATILGLGMGTATADTSPDRPILTKSGQQAAIQAAAAAVRRQAAPTEQLGAKTAALGAEVVPQAVPPTSPVDQTKIPHYFGPFPNWANSPLTLPDVKVTINGDGQDAQATATVGANGLISGITIDNPGNGYTFATVTIRRASDGWDGGARAVPTVTRGAVVTSIDILTKGAGYTAPQVKVIGGGTAIAATATAYGSVNAISVTSGGSGYTIPTVAIDLPTSPDGVMAQAHAVCDNDPNAACGTAGPGTVTGIIVDQPGSGYTVAPDIHLRDGTAADPIRNNPGTGADAKSTLRIESVALNTFGSGYATVPTVAITDAPGGIGAGATAKAYILRGAITNIALTVKGSGYVTQGGIKKFYDTLPKLCNPAVAGSCDAAKNNLGQFIPLGVPDTTTFGATFATDGTPIPASDYYVIALVEYRKRMSSSLPNSGTLVRGYVQLKTDDDGNVVSFGPDGYVTEPQWLGPILAARKDKPVRVTFYNLLPTGQDGDLFIPTDSTLMGSGTIGNWPTTEGDGTVLDEIRNPACTVDSQYVDPDGRGCFKQNRATLHLHGGLSPWISDGTPHQWITPTGENTTYPEGVSVGNVPDMGSVGCDGMTDGCMTFYYTNQQSARLMFYHDHAWGITRLNVYAGEAAGYIISDPTEDKLIADGVIPGPADQIPLIIQDRTYVPETAQLSEQDPTWDVTRWGSYGDFWYHHVYMPAQNPGDASGMSAYGRWMFGPWFWPPATPQFPPIANPYYNMDPNAIPPFSVALATPCNIDDPDTWQYQTDPFCEPPLIPGTPNIAAGMEQFNDTPVVNGTLYPTTTLQPKAYRFRVLNAANDRFWNLQWYVADPSTASTQKNALGQLIGGTEVALNPQELAAAHLDPVAFPTPVQSAATAGPDWIQIGNEGGFLPAPVVIDGQQFTTWITDPTRFDVGNVDLHSLLLAPAERADVIVDFSKFAGRTLILYNDAPAAFPARVPSYDYYTGGPDLSPVGAPTILPGYGPNTRTIMQVKVAASTPAPAFNLDKLKTAFEFKANGTGVFEAGQHPIIIGQSVYNSAYGKAFASGGDCNLPGVESDICDGYGRIANQGGEMFGFNTLITGTTGKLKVRLEPKAIHDEMNSAAFDEFGRMSANMGLEVFPATPALQNIVLYPYVNPQTELIDGTKLPSSMDVMPISVADDGTQIWKITHNGVDTHPLHFHLYDVQVLNRVAWDNIISVPDANELGWKETVRVNPLQDTFVALRPVLPVLPFELPNSIRLMNPMTPPGSEMGFNPRDAAGNPTDPILNQLVNYGWEYVWHCHILSHEEMDMMRPQSVAVPPIVPDQLASSIDAGHVKLTWMDNSITETAFLVQRSTDGTTWVDVGTDPSPLDVTNTKGVVRTLTDPATYNPDEALQYRVIAQNTIGYGGQFMSMTAESISDSIIVGGIAVTAPSDLLAVAGAGPSVTLNFTHNATDETGFVIERQLNGGSWVQIDTLGPNVVTYLDTTVKGGVNDASPNNAYRYRVAAVNLVKKSDYAVSIEVVVTKFPTAPANVGIQWTDSTTGYVVWTDASTNETRFQVQTWDGSNWVNSGPPIDRDPTQSHQTDEVLTQALSGANTLYRVLAQNVTGSTVSVDVSLAKTVAPIGVSVTRTDATHATLAWTDASNNETSFQVQTSINNGTTWTNTNAAIARSGVLPNSVGEGLTSTLGVTASTNSLYRVLANNGAGSSPSGSVRLNNTVAPDAPGPVAPDAPTVNCVRVGLTGYANCTVTWTDLSNNNTSFQVQRANNPGFSLAVNNTPALTANAVTTTFTNLSRTLPWYFRVRAVNNSGSPYSGWVTAKPSPYPLPIN